MATGSHQGGDIQNLWLSTDDSTQWGVYGELVGKIQRWFSNIIQTLSPTNREVKNCQKTPERHVFLSNALLPWILDSNIYLNYHYTIGACSGVAHEVLCA